MTEELDPGATTTDHPGDDPERPALTGNAVVDDVLAGLTSLGGKPVDEHVAVFEQAHERLRGVLDGARMPRS